MVTKRAQAYSCIPISHKWLLFFPNIQEDIGSSCIIFFFTPCDNNSGATYILLSSPSLSPTNSKSGKKMTHPSYATHRITWRIPCYARRGITILLLTHRPVWLPYSTAKWRNDANKSMISAYLAKTAAINAHQYEVMRVMMPSFCCQTHTRTINQDLFWIATNPAIIFYFEQKSSHYLQ